MNRYPLWKYILALVSILAGFLYTIPNFYGEAPAVQISPSNAATVVDTTLLSKVSQILKNEHIAFDSVSLQQGSIKVRFAETTSQIKAKDVLSSSLGKGYVVALNLLSLSPSWLEAIHARPMYLGLDLRGGVHFLLQVDMKAAVDKTIQSNIIDLRNLLRKKRIIYLGTERVGDAIQIRFRNPADLAAAEKEIRSIYGDLLIKTANTDQDYRLIATLSPMERKQIQDFALKQNMQTLRNRVNELGVAEPIIQQQGLDRIVVQLPGVQDTAKAKEILGRTATLELRLVNETKSDPITLQEAAAGKVPSDSEFYISRNKQPLLVSKEVLLTGEHITNATPGMDDQSVGAVVNVTLNGYGASLFKQITRDNVGKRLAILLIEQNQTEIVTAPVIREEIGGGRVQISGMASLQEATDIALLLRAGALATPMSIIEERTVGPSMGAENIQRGFNSTLWGFTAVSIVMLVYYLVFGVIAITALASNLLLLVAILSALQATLTLPGLAAIALAVGMAIDANVLINERIREELRNGNTPQAAIKLGYERAFATIVDSNVTTLFVGMGLFLFGTGPIKGFAVVHILGILSSMFTAVLVSRSLVNLTYGYQRKVKKLLIG